jgi:hypothetical protein
MKATRPPGGIFRNVTLCAVPQVFISDVFAKRVKVLDADRHVAVTLFDRRSRHHRQTCSDQCRTDERRTCVCQRATDPETGERR